MSTEIKYFYKKDVQSLFSVTDLKYPNYNEDIKSAQNIIDQVKRLANENKYLNIDIASAMGSSSGDFSIDQMKKNVKDIQFYFKMYQDLYIQNANKGDILLNNNNPLAKPDNSDITNLQNLVKNGNPGTNIVVNNTVAKPEIKPYSELVKPLISVSKTTPENIPGNNTNPVIVVSDSPETVKQSAISNPNQAVIDNLAALTGVEAGGAKINTGDISLQKTNINTVVLIAVAIIIVMVIK
jgi:hypothetical protein